MEWEWHGANACIHLLDFSFNTTIIKKKNLCFASILNLFYVWFYVGFGWWFIFKYNTDFVLLYLPMISTWFNTILLADWVEFTPYEIGMAKYGTFMPPELFGSKFYMGSVIKKYEEYPLRFLMGE